MDANSMDTHIKVIAWLYIVLGALMLFSACIAVFAIFGGGLISGDQTAINVTGIVAAIVGILIVVFSVPGIIAGFGLLRYQAWARILALVLGVLNLPGFPIGTILGIYTLWALLDEEGAALFQKEAEPEAA